MAGVGFVLLFFFWGGGLFSFTFVVFLCCFDCVFGIIVMHVNVGFDWLFTEGECFTVCLFQLFFCCPTSWG